MSGATNTHTSTSNSTTATITSNYFPVNGYAMSEHRLDPIARILLIGVYDDSNPLSILRGMRYIVQYVWELTLQFNRQYYSKFIEPPSKAKDTVDSVPALQKVGYLHKPDDWQWAIEFPEPLDHEININMMPILMDRYNLEGQLPAELQGYVPLLDACLSVDDSQDGCICFVTIHESFVKQGNSQRRPGLHIELPGKQAGGIAWRDTIGWGAGASAGANGYQTCVVDGIFMASTVRDSCALWNCRVLDRDTETESESERESDSDNHKYNNNDESDSHRMIPITNDFGGIEHLRSVLREQERHVMEASALYWLTDRTPHESLPMKKSGKRQFFRLVSSKVSVWYEDHSTKNPNGVVPNPRITTIVKGNKFIHQ